MADNIKIVGNTVGVPNPRSDWSQTDPTKADYIKNKPDIESKADKEDIPVKLSDLADDITQRSYEPTSEKPQSGKAVAEAIAKLLGSAPANLDTLEELAKALNEDENFSASVLAEIAKKADTTALANKVDKVSGKGLSEANFTNKEKEKLSKTNIYTKAEKEKLDTIINFIVLEDEHYLDNDIILDCLKRGNYSRGLNVVRTSIEDGLLLVSLTDYYEAVYIDYYGRTTHFESVTADDEDWVEDIGEQYATHSYVDRSIRNAIGDVETSLENIIQKYGLGGDGV